MRTAITRARRHGEQKFVTLHDESVPLDKQLSAFKATVAGNHKTHPEFAEIHVSTSDAGRIKFIKLSKPEPVKPVAPVEPQTPEAAPESSSSETSEAKPQSSKQQKNRR
jgi:hypothetical protein